MRVNPIVIYTIKPSGTLAVMTPIANTKFRIAGYPIANPRPNKDPPINTEKMVNLMINLLIYFWRGVISSVYPADATRLAVWPMNVLLPVAKTMPLPVPYLFKVEKKAILWV